MLTGPDWAQPFLKGNISSAPRTESAKYVEGVFELALAGCAHKTRIVVSKHPQGKRESLLVEEVVTAFGERMEVSAPSAVRAVRG